MQIQCAQAGARRPEPILCSVLAFALLLTIHANAKASGAPPAPRGTQGTALRDAAAVDPAATPPGRPASTLETASPDVRYVADWVARTGDNAGMPYVIVDKVHATVFVMSAEGHFDGAAPALLGMVRGDGTVDGIGDRKLSAIRPNERTTPAGRYVASLGRDPHGQDILWIDYVSALALHRVVKGTPAEHRAQRLLSDTADDNRISYGCINVPVAFYERIVHPLFAHSSGVVYILPETSSARAMFGPAVTASP
jgi:hypothetical protein